ncbi:MULTISPECIES: N-acetylmuramoyl-L-alanine amidase [Sorangium]|uniref:N-acetylmuramoyl-L-alanine amidase n=1 Tax=Sorangium cellulosum TaxID=56 RepID=A0A4P2QHC1_SORCE|nr:MULTISPECIES: N-acetylmuramoyl-L-alanine amidase [Sorangium]AUX29280.1 N-acetylmuramoyl-L-alanine amidase [Sorangium cellulosum]WCQ88670.1 endolysin [Sorangium sp. Soce836]
MISRRKLVLGLAGAAGAAALSRALAPGLPRDIAARRALKLPIAPSGWPFPGARVVAPSAVFPPDFGVRRIYLDAGHGAPGNTGNVSCFCVEEQEFTLSAARALAERLNATGRFEARVGRTGDRPLPYAERVEDAARWGADAFVSLHSDVRGRIDTWSPAEGRSCPLSLAAPGFAVLWSDEGDPALGARRLALARAFARRMEEAGLLPYGGAAYSGLYAPDTAQPGVFVDRRPQDQRIFVLRRPAMPSILIETHHALDAREATRWTEPATLDAFAAAAAAALADALGGGGAPASQPPT